MLEVTEINYIRQQVNGKGHTYAEVARRTNRDPRTVQKYADLDEFQPELKGRKPQPSPVMDPVKEIVDQWLREDLKKKKKYRRTAKRIWELLKEECGFKGSDRTVRAYVSKRKIELLEEMEANDEAALPLEASPGDAQVDFGEAPFKVEGEVIELPYLVMSFPYSNAFLVQVFESQNQDCFLEGMKRFFHHLGGVPRRVRFDNLSPAVKKILPHGRRELTEGFERFVLHYGFEYEFCNPGSGNEKGHVEAMVKYVRNNFFLPERRVFQLDEFNTKLWGEAEKDRHRQHYEKKEEISKLFEEDKHAFLHLPAKEYSCVRYETLKADKYGFVQVDTKKYSTSPRYAKQKVLVAITYDQVTILSDRYEKIVRHNRIYGNASKSMVWQPYLSLMATRPTALKYTTFYGQLPERWRSYLNECTVEEKKEALKLLSTLLKEHSLEKATEALEIASKRIHPSSESIKQVFHQLIHGRGYRDTLEMKPSIPVMPVAERGIKKYDVFFSSKRRQA
ncbi:IS21 family transposase [Lederbergia sp. NSJ-179]|uniref:IS21 family transposase n=3 Tax=Bacillaceae TaxID=186817 RepID=A0A443IJ98_9BACI|nr:MULTISPECIES: IS21 family transposase [Bacillaceae]KRG11338.1 integrase [Virgibacillus soli]MCJ7840687.1 IS21 family transposase [Lederbergia sp. NSJ-179]RWR04342.1 IS21 family transposase [Siminovitchia fortis]WHY80685.1 IS21 family transposase [Siminovitchia fortis]